MPIYGYKCTNKKCKHEFEVIKGFDAMDKEELCEQCSAKAERQISRSNFALQGSGWPSKEFKR